jgi:hypothetical protein
VHPEYPCSTPEYPEYPIAPRVPLEYPYSTPSTLSTPSTPSTPIAPRVPLVHPEYPEYPYSTPSTPSTARYPTLQGIRRGVVSRTAGCLPQQGIRRRNAPSRGGRAKRERARIRTAQMGRRRAHLTMHASVRDGLARNASAPSAACSRAAGGRTRQWQRPRIPTYAKRIPAYASRRFGRSFVARCGCGGGWKLELRCVLQAGENGTCRSDRA